MTTVELVKALAEAAFAVLVPALLAVLVPLATRGLGFLASAARAKDMELLNGALTRAAGQIYEAVHNSPMAEAAGDALLRHGVRYVRASFPDLLKRLGNPSEDHLVEMLRGELGKLQAAARVT